MTFEKLPEFLEIPRGYRIVSNVPEALFPVEADGQPLGKVHVPLMYFDTIRMSAYECWAIILPWQPDIVKQTLFGVYSENTYVVLGWISPVKDMKFVVQYAYWINREQWEHIFIREKSRRGALWTSNYQHEY